MYSETTQNNKPAVSVILPVYNGSRYLSATLNAILSQSYSDFELIIINDGSSDDSESVIKNFNDSRIRYFSQKNQGLPATLNRAIGLAQGEFIARQDQDDISFPSRLERQVEFLTKNHDVGMVGTNAEIWESNVKTDRLLEHPSDDAVIKFNLLFDNPFVHSSVMIRKSVFDNVGLYCEDKSRQPPEDYELWSRVAKKYKLANLPEVLLAYREVPNSMSRTGVNPFLDRLITISTENIAFYSGSDIGAPEVVATAKLAHGVYDGIPKALDFSKIMRLANGAAKTIVENSTTRSDELDSIVSLRIAMLRYHYFQYKTGGRFSRFMASDLLRYPKNIFKRIIGR